ncbi:MAG: AsmA-like C-terminal region-containing protein, partial [Pseudomonadota bacterium]
IEELLQTLGYKEDRLKGRLTMEAVLFMRGKNEKELISSLAGSGNILMKQGVIKRSHTLIKVLDLLNIGKIFKERPPDLSREGFYFESIGGHVSIEKGILDTQNVMMKSPIFNAVASGKIDLVRETMDSTLGVQPLQTLDTLISNIPILGYVLTGKEKTFLTYYFKVQGPIFDPAVEYVPFKNLGTGVAGVLKRLFLTPTRIFEKLTKLPEGFEEPDSPFPLLLEEPL